MHLHRPGGRTIAKWDVREPDIAVSDKFKPNFDVNQRLLVATMADQA